MADSKIRNAQATTLGDMLRASQWASGLSAGELARVELGVFERRIAAGDFVCRKGEPVEHWLGVIDGLLKPPRSGHWRPPFCRHPGGRLVGEGRCSRPSRSLYAIALRDSRVALMRRETFDWLPITASNSIVSADPPTRRPASSSARSSRSPAPHRRAVTRSLTALFNRCSTPPPART